MIVLKELYVHCTYNRSFTGSIGDLQMADYSKIVSVIVRLHVMTLKFDMLMACNNNNSQIMFTVTDCLH